LEAALEAAGLPPLPRPAWLAIDLDRLSGNVAAIRSALPAGVRLEPVLKADAYGHGAVGVASWLETCGIEGFSVATLDEAAELRRAGIGLPILVLFPIPPDLVREALRLDVALTAGDVALLARTLEAVGRGLPLEAGGGPALTLHLEVETGLGRGGFDETELPSAVKAIEGTSRVRLGGIWSHLAAAGDRQRTSGQQARFERALGSLPAADGELAVRHFAGSGGVLAATVPPFDGVRIGLSTYGLVPDGLLPAAERVVAAGHLKAAMSLHARPVRVVELPARHGVSYGPSFETSRTSRIATLPIGYGDGWSRQLSNRSEALVRGVRVPLVGTVAMDAVMADVTDVPGAPVNVDDEFVLLGEQEDDAITVLDLAQRRTTISYEVLTSMARRVARVYYRATVPVGLRTLTEETYAWRPLNSGTGTFATSKSTRS
jgi:alanine racemase